MQRPTERLPLVEPLHAARSEAISDEVAQPVLAILGINREEMTLYRTLLINPDTSIDQLANEAQIPKSRAQKVLGRLVARDFLISLPEQGRFFPRSPKRVLLPYVSAKQDALNDASEVVEELIALTPKEVERVESGQKSLQEIFFDSQKGIISKEPTEAIRDFFEELDSEEQLIIVVADIDDAGAIFESLETVRSNGNNVVIIIDSLAARKSLYGQEILKLRAKEIRVSIHNTSANIMIIPDKKALYLTSVDGKSYAYTTEDPAKVDDHYNAYKEIADRALPIPSTKDMSKLGLSIDKNVLLLQLLGLEGKNAATNLNMAPRTYTKRVSKNLKGLDLVGKSGVGFPLVRDGIIPKMTDIAREGLSISEDEKVMLRGMLSCVPDTRLAREMNMGLRTLTRQVNLLTGRFGIKTRLQLGVQIARYGLCPYSESLPLEQQSLDIPE